LLAQRRPDLGDHGHEVGHVTLQLADCLLLLFQAPVDVENLARKPAADLLFLTCLSLRRLQNRGFIFLRRETLL
jgi:hypothetical protein